MLEGGLRVLFETQQMLCEISTKKLKNAEPLAPDPYLGNRKELVKT